MSDLAWARSGIRAVRCVHNAHHDAAATTTNPAATNHHHHHHGTPTPTKTPRGSAREPAPQAGQAALPVACARTTHTTPPPALVNRRVPVATTLGAALPAGQMPAPCEEVWRCRRRRSLRWPEYSKRVGMPRRQGLVLSRPIDSSAAHHPKTAPAEPRTHTSAGWRVWPDPSHCGALTTKQPLAHRSNSALPTAWPILWTSTPKSLHAPVRPAPGQTAIDQARETPPSTEASFPAADPADGGRTRRGDDCGCRPQAAITSRHGGPQPPSLQPAADDDKREGP